MAQYSLGFMYANGQGVPQDFVQAHREEKGVSLGSRF